ncbi:hypothetical protein SCLCIDRAFT_21798 [Scleroderma citrinum Foug A]|uniref:Uncharacterized protein n=1 Tax=Scleroderma citrinum Foug A TaxID=1036808 RepID=A0A0C3EED0_9AGAM|nr:hypothetical protein SCLCIDRAFT_21798 [Scleroderma citrinum Foug A]
MDHGEGAGTYLNIGDVKHTVLEMGGIGCHVDASTGQTDTSSIEMDAVIPTNTMEIVSIPQRKQKLPDSPVDNTRTAPDEPNGIGSHTDALSGPMDIPSVEMNTGMPAKAPENISITQKKDKPPNLHMEATRQCSNESNACGDQTDMLIACMDTHTIGDETKTAENGRGDVRTGQIDLRKQNSLYMTEVRTPKPTYQWGKSEEEAIAPSLEGETAERAGNGNGNQDRDGDGEDGTMSSGPVDSDRVEEALLAGDSQYKRQG